jgi:uncharacterized protein YbaR (Trm112 family)
MPRSGAADAVTRLAREAVQTGRALRRNRVRHRPAPPAAGPVLDVGAGQSAHPRADVIVDKYVADDFERAAELDLAKPLVVADGHALPFADATFAYVIASHVLEHATDPVRFAGELSRVAAEGFVQVPSREAELTFGWPFHPWLIDLEDGALVFHPRGELKAPAGAHFHQSFAASTLFRIWFEADRDTWHHTLHWNGSIPVRVNGTSRAPERATLDVERTLATLGRLEALGPEGALRAALRCPVDGGQLREGSGRLVCDRCDRSYPVEHGVPVLLREAAA